MCECLREWEGKKERKKINRYSNSSYFQKRLRCSCCQGQQISIKVTYWRSIDLWMNAHIHTLCWAEHNATGRVWVMKEQWMNLDREVEKERYTEKRNKQRKKQKRKNKRKRRMILQREETNSSESIEATKHQWKKGNEWLYAHKRE